MTATEAAVCGMTANQWCDLVESAGAYCVYGCVVDRISVAVSLWIGPTPYLLHLWPGDRCHLTDGQGRRWCVDVPPQSVPAVVASWIRRLADEAGAA